MPEPVLEPELLQESVAVRRHELRAELGYHVTVLVIASAMILMSILMRTTGEHFVFLPGSVFPMPPSCLSRQLFGIECPGCGLTRAFISISDGNLARAWHFNPASLVVYPFVLGQIPWRLFQMSRIYRNRPPIFSPWLFVPLFVASGLLIAQWLLKLTGIYHA